MAYFDGIKVGDKVWSFLNGWEKVIDIPEKGNIFETENEYYNYNGYLLDADFDVISEERIVFWDTIKIDPPEKPKIKLENDYSDNIDRYYFGNVDSLEQLIKFAKLLALRDQECPDSKGYEFLEGEKNWYIYSENDYYLFGAYSYYAPDKIYFRTKEDVQKICDILNEGRFEL